MDREKVVKGLECCAVGAECDHCPYVCMNNGGFQGCYQMHQDALALLKAQEPRVMALIEWIKAPEPADGECMCYEIKNKGLQAMLVKAFDGTRHLYGKAFRVWTSKPSSKQMEETPWE